MDLINLDRVKQLTGAKTDEEAALKLKTVLEVIEDFLGVVLFKTDFKDEKISLAYGNCRYIRPNHTPVNEVYEIKFFNPDSGKYESQTDFKYITGGETIDFLNRRVLKKPASGRILLSYNAGLYSDASEVPATITLAAEKLLDYLFASGFGGAYQSEHLGDYSYSKGATDSGLPADIAALLNGVKL